MTEADWLAATDPGPMLGHVRQVGKLTARKWRLFAVTCCRRVEHLLVDYRSRHAVDVAERFADGAATADELEAVFDAAFDAAAEMSEEYLADQEAFAAAGRDPSRYAAWAASDAAHPDESADGAAGEAEAASGSPDERGVQRDLLRCVFGNPFRPVAVDPAWLTSSVVGVARAAYDGRDFGRLPVLADALQDAGCDDADVLDHCRGGGPHARGCWVVDLVLGRA